MISELAQGYPGYDGIIAPSRGFLSEILHEKGYANYAIGKWHLMPVEEATMSGPFDREETGSLEAELDRFFRTLTPPAAGVVVAVSGGPDSTALLQALACLSGRSFPLHAAHVNHHLRGAASEGDAAWVRSYCAELGVPLSLLDGALDPAHVRREGAAVDGQSPADTLFYKWEDKGYDAYVALYTTRV